MKIVTLTSPGRFPTVVHDPGQWWSTLAEDSSCQLLRFSANAEWWRVVCSPEVFSVLGRSAHRALWWIRGLHGAASHAAEALERLRDSCVYGSAPSYIEAVSVIADHLRALNRIQSELSFSLEAGVRVRSVDYSSSRSLVDHAQRETILSALVDASLRSCPRDIDLLVVSVTSAEDMLSALIAVHCLRRICGKMHACLADHGYENFTLAPHLERLKAVRTLDTIFDSIIESKDERDAILPRLARAIEAGRAPRGFLTLSKVSVPGVSPLAGRYLPPPPVPTFANQPVFWTRISPRRCYWSRCTFCIHNVKYSDPTPPLLQEIPRALDRMEALLAAGYHVLYFSDEALSPAMLAAFCKGVEERQLKFNWACRCKLERAFTTDLFGAMRTAGCVEVLFGLESISPRIQRLMDKYVEGLDARAIEYIFRAAAAAGIGLHANLIAGFPGDSTEEAVASVEFLVKVLSKLPNVTFTLNRFVLFPGTPIMRNPELFGVLPTEDGGDMPMSHPYRLTAEHEANWFAVDRLLPALERRLLTAFGWDLVGRSSGVAAAREMYFSSGHSILFKADPQNPFAYPSGFNAGGRTDAGETNIPNWGDWLLRASRAV